MNVSIHIASHAKDRDYLFWCLRSIIKFARGFYRVVVTVPAQEIKQFPRNELPGQPLVTTYTRTPDTSRWQLQAQIQKCRADIHCPRADFILHMDSDCIFTDHVRPEDYFIDDKPYMLIESYEHLPADTPWKAVTEKVLGQPCAWETMRRHPQVNPVAVYSELRQHVESVHHLPFEVWVLTQRGGWPPGFSEHNAIGSFALAHPQLKNEYHWIDVKKDPVPPDRIKQFWSLSPVDQPQGTPHDHDQVVPLKICQDIIGA